MEDSNRKTEHIDEPALPPTPVNDLPAVEPSQLWTRRRIITLALSLSAGVVAGFGPWFMKKSDLRKGKPRFLTRTRKTPPLSTEVELPTGFYTRPPHPITQRLSSSTRAKTPIIHYVAAQDPNEPNTKKKILFVKAINQNRLRSANLNELALKSGNTHVNFARASVSFELAALELIRNKQYEEACERLLDGIKHDLASKAFNGGRPSLRLFDLLAIVACRRGLNRYSDALQKRTQEVRVLMDYERPQAPAARKRRGGKAQASPYAAEQQDHAAQQELEEFRKKREEAFDKRVRKWKDQQSNWYKRVKDTKQELTWSVTIPQVAIKVLL